MGLVRFCPHVVRPSEDEREKRRRVEFPGGVDRWAGGFVLGFDRLKKEIARGFAEKRDIQADERVSRVARKSRSIDFFHFERAFPERGMTRFRFDKFVQGLREFALGARAKGLVEGEVGQFALNELLLVR
jgi:hypothetical protein